MEAFVKALQNKKTDGAGDDKTQTPAASDESKKKDDDDGMALD